MTDSSKTASSNTGPGSKPALEQPVVRSASETPLAFYQGLVLRLQSLDQSLRLAKVMVKGSDQVQIMGIIRNEWNTQVPMQALRGIRFGPLSLDHYEMPPGYGKYQLIGGLVEVPLDNLRGFMWVSDEDEGNYWTQWTSFAELN